MRLMHVVPIQNNDSFSQLCELQPYGLTALACSILLLPAKRCPEIPKVSVNAIPAVLSKYFTAIVFLNVLILASIDTGNATNSFSISIRLYGIDTIRAIDIDMQVHSRIDIVIMISI